MNDLEVLRTARPRVAPPSPAVENHARLNLAEAIRATAGQDQAQGVAALARFSPMTAVRRVGAGFAAAAAAAAVLAALPGSEFGGTGGRQVDTPAQAFLLAAAETAAESDGRDAADAPFWYVKSTVTGAQAAAGTREIWLGRDRPGRVVTDGEALPLDGPASFAGMSWEELVSLPTDTDELRNAIYDTENGDGGPDEEAFEVVSALLRESPAPAELRGALLRVAATIPGVALTPDMPDSLGRRASVVSKKSGDGATESRLWLSDSDAQVLQVETVALRTLTQPDGAASLSAGTLLHRATVLEAGPASQAG